MEGHFETGHGQPLVLLGWPDMAAETTHYPIEVPYLGSLILTHDWDGEVKGLKAWPVQRLAEGKSLLREVSIDKINDGFTREPPAQSRSNEAPP